MLVWVLNATAFAAGIFVSESLPGQSPPDIVSPTAAIPAVRTAASGHNTGSIPAAAHAASSPPSPSDGA